VKKKGADLIPEIEEEIQEDRAEAVRDKLKEYYLEVQQAKKTVAMLEEKFQKLLDMPLEDLVDELNVYP